MAIALNRNHIVILLSLCLAGLPLNNSAALAQDLIDLEEIAPDSGTAMDEDGQVLPDTGTYIPKKKPAGKSTPTNGGIAEPVEVIAEPTPKAEKSNSASGNKAENKDANADSSALTKLQAEIEGIWQSGALTGVRAKVRNIGTKRATQIKVKATVPGSAPITLEGPEALDAGAVGEYTQMIPPSRQIAGNIRVFSACENCVSTSRN